MSPFRDLEHVREFVSRVKVAIDTLSSAQQVRLGVRAEEFLPRAERERYAADRLSLALDLFDWEDCQVRLARFPDDGLAPRIMSRREDSLVILGRLHGQEP